MSQVPPVGDSTTIPVDNSSSQSTPSEGLDGDFANDLTDYIDRIDQLQIEADIEASKLAHGDGNLHETAIAFEKADVALRLAMKIRNKAVDAYQEVMRMPV